jgi:4-hydroxy-tetrahydrodipicolinate synthase
MVTPFHGDGSVDYDAFQALARHLVENGSDGVVVAGTTGESPTLTDSERRDLIRAALEAVGDSAAVVAGTGTYSTAHSVHLTEEAHELGADGLLVVTPFDADGRVDYDAYRELCAFLVDNGSDGVVVNGTTGEASTLSDEERTGLIRVALEAVGDRATVVAGTGTNSTAQSIELTAQAQEAGAHAVLVVTPYYNKPPQRGIVAHFEAVAAATDLPVIAYNIPGRCVINIEPETMTELAQIPNVNAVKQSNADLDQARHIVELGLDLYAGDDNLVLPFVELGGLGGICVHTHVVGPQVKEMVQRFRAGDLEAARQLDDELAAAYELIGVVTGPIQIKAALNLLGHDVGGVRLPLVEASEDEVAQIRSCLERLRLLEPSRVA